MDDEERLSPAARDAIDRYHVKWLAIIDRAFSAQGEARD